MVAYSFKRRFVTRIQVGLGQMEHIPGTEYLPKRQTIRPVGKRRHAWPGETVQLYTAMRTKQCRKIGDGQCVRVDPIRIHVEGGRITIAAGTPDERAIDKTVELDAFAQRDGFADWADMREFWRQEHGDLARLGPFVGILILWEPKP